MSSLFCRVLRYISRTSAFFTPEIGHLIWIMNCVFASFSPYYVCFSFPPSFLVLHMHLNSLKLLNSYAHLKLLQRDIFNANHNYILHVKRTLLGNVFTSSFNILCISYTYVRTRSVMFSFSFAVCYAILQEG